MFSSTTCSIYYLYILQMKRITNNEWLKHNVHPAKSGVVVLTQVPLWVSMSFALRNMSGTIPVTGLGKTFTLKRAM